MPCGYESVFLRSEREDPWTGPDAQARILAASSLLKLIIAGLIEARQPQETTVTQHSARYENHESSYLQFKSAPLKSQHGNIKLMSSLCK